MIGIKFLYLYLYLLLESINNSFCLYLSVLGQLLFSAKKQLIIIKKTKIQLREVILRIL